jgi:hypothetical protein
VARTPTVVLVEGDSDRVAVETLARRFGRDLTADGVRVVATGGATNVGGFLRGIEHGVAVAALCDAREEGLVRRAFERAGVDPSAVHVCDADLEDELIRALGTSGVERVVALAGDLASLRTFQAQPAQRGRTTDAQLRRFMGTRSGRKRRYARLLVEALDPGRVPRPLADLLAGV